MDAYEILSALTAAPGTSGSEEGAALVAEKLFREFTDDVWRDPLGNVYARVGSGRPVVLITAHMDEIGMCVTSIEPNGMLRVRQVGGIDPRVLPGSEVTVHGTEPIPGIIGAVPPHLTGGDTKAAYKLEELTVDTGYPVEDVEKMIGVGDIVTFAPVAPTKLKNDLVACKTMDDRALITVELETLKRLAKRKYGCTVIFCATVQEEVGCFGAKIAGEHIAADISVAMDVSHAPTPDSPAFRTTPVDKAAMTRGGNIHPVLYEWLSGAADRARVPFETIVTMGATGTDARALQLARDGVPTCLLELPLKYMHTSVEVGSLRVVGYCADILTEFLCSIGDDWEEKICWND